MKQAGLSMLSCSKELHPKKRLPSKETTIHRAFPTQLLQIATLMCSVTVLSRTAISFFVSIVTLLCSCTACLLRHEAIKQHYFGRSRLSPSDGKIPHSKPANQTKKQTPKNPTKSPQRHIYLNYITPGIPNPRDYLVLLPKNKRYTFAVSPRPFSDC